MSQTVSYLWREPRAADVFAGGVSLHLVIRTNPKRRWTLSRSFRPSGVSCSR